MATRREALRLLGGLLLGGPAAARAQDELSLRHPALAAAPRLAVGGLPTPVRARPELARALGLGALYVKDDGVAGRPFGGSKARKLAYLLAAAEGAGGRSVLTFGSIGSNHALATAILGGQRGFAVHLVLLPEPPGPHLRRRLLAARSAGARLHAGTRRDLAQAAATRDRLAPGAALLPLGGTSPTGSLGYVEAALELAAQVAGGLPAPDVLYVAAGTGGAAAGLLVGLAATSLPTRVVAVRVSGRASRGRLLAEAGATHRLLRRLDPSFPALDPARLRVDGRHLGRGYALPTRAGRRALDRAAPLALDLTYTAKALAALADHRGAHREETVLFWNTFDARIPGPGDATDVDLPPRLRAFLRE